MSVRYFRARYFAARYFFLLYGGAHHVEPPRTSDGVNLIVDPQSGYNAGSIVVNKPITLVINAGVDLPTDQTLKLIFTKPDGTTYIPAPTEFLYIGDKQLTGTFFIEFYTFFLPGQYAVYTSLPNEIDQVGVWQVYVQAGVFASPIGYFTVTP